MLKKQIKYEDFNGDEVNETLYFNLSTTELLEMETSTDGGMQAKLERIIEEQDPRKLLDEFKAILLASYGKRSDDGKRFIKNDQIREEFQQSAAFDALFMEMLEDPAGGAQFVNGIMPKKVAEQAKAMQRDGIPKGISGAVDTPPVD